jgi:hypothetical protein
MVAQARRQTPEDRIAGGLDLLGCHFSGQPRSNFKPTQGIAFKAGAARGKFSEKSAELFVPKKICLSAFKYQNL